jgi:anthranilate phosphoribosyltransferase
MSAPSLPHAGVIRDALARVVRHETLAAADMESVVAEMVSGAADERQSAALLAALRTRGETVEELVGAARAVRARALPLPDAPPGTIDTCGTGGDGSDTFNISTAAALVVAGAGVPVAKHGNRRATSRVCGSAEVLEALGVPLDVSPNVMASAVFEVGIGFLFARLCHPAFAHIAPVRAALGVPTLFNRLGPLCNPMRVRRYLLGVGAAEHQADAAAVLAALGVERAWVVHSEDGLDEISTCAPSHVEIVEGLARRRIVVEPGAWVPPARPEDLRGGEPADSAAIISEVIRGKPGPARDIVLLNAAAGLCVAGRAHDLGEGLAQAAAAVDGGAVARLLERWIEHCRRAQAAESEGAA